MISGISLCLTSGSAAQQPGAGAAQQGGRDPPPQVLPDQNNFIILELYLCSLLIQLKQILYFVPMR